MYNATEPKEALCKCICSEHVDESDIIEGLKVSRKKSGRGLSYAYLTTLVLGPVGKKGGGAGAAQAEAWTHGGGSGLLGKGSNFWNTD